MKQNLKSQNQKNKHLQKAQIWKMNPNLSKRTWTLKPNLKSKPTHLKNFQLRNNTSYTQKPKNQKAIQSDTLWCSNLEKS